VCCSKSPTGRSSLGGFYLLSFGQSSYLPE
jgi:hypothetical protein